MKVRLTVLAKADMLAQIDWLAKRSPQAARRARSALLERLAGLTEFPLAAALVDDDIARLWFGSAETATSYATARSKMSFW